MGCLGCIVLRSLAQLTTEAGIGKIATNCKIRDIGLRDRKSAWLEVKWTTAGHPVSCADAFISVNTSPL
jgi:hypothetical protein